MIPEEGSSDTFKLCTLNTVDCNIIPAITSSLGMYWKQPPLSEITITDDAALMNRKAFNELAEYSASVPTGVYVGKIWKCEISGMVWLLRWYTFSNDGADYCTIQSRQITITV